GDDLVEQLLEGRAAQDPGGAGLLVELEQPGDRGGVHDQAAGVDRLVAVGAAQPSHDRAAGSGRLHGHGQLVRARGPDDVGRGPRVAPPAAQQLAAGVARPSRAAGPVVGGSGGHAVYTPMAKTTAQASPMSCSGRSWRTMSSGAEPRPWSSTSA